MKVASRLGRTAALVAVACLAVGFRARAQDRRPSEDEMFGGKPAEPPKTAPSASAPAPAPPATGSAAPPAAPGSGAPAQGEKGPAEPAATQAPTPAKPAGAASAPESKTGSADGRDEAILGGHESQMFTEEAAPSDPLRIGGQLYMRLQTTALEGQRFVDSSFIAPTLLDVYLDARPNDRVRGFVLARIAYDPTLPITSGPNAAPGGDTGGTSGSASLSSLFVQQTRDPRFFLDQVWLKFDIAHSVFVTAGKQHVRWGTGHFWSPSDVLHLRYRNPLDVFDARTGTTMVKLHVPIESKGWNFYAYGITESPTATVSLSQIGGAARAEFVLDTAELGFGALVRKGDDPKITADLSIGIGDFDVYGEVALKNGSDIDRVSYNPAADISGIPTDAPNYVQQVADAVYPVYRERGYRPQAVGGVTYSQKYNDNDTFTVGAEYFYNGLGYSSPDAYLGLVLPHSTDLVEAAPFFYLGRHYGSLYVTFPAPFKLDLHTFTLSTLANMSDQSFITRFDYALVLLTHLRFEAFTSVRYGNPEGEFRFGTKSVLYTRAPAIFDLGLALRLAI